MEYYYKPLGQAYDQNSILAIVGVNPDAMDEETLVQHHLYPVVNQDRDPFLFTSGIYRYEIESNKALRFVDDYPIEIDEARSTGRRLLKEFLESEFDRLLRDNGLSLELLTALQLSKQISTEDLFESELSNLRSHVHEITTAIAKVDEATDFDSVKQIVIAACKRN